MPLRGVEIKLPFKLWDVVNSQYVTGDLANLSMTWLRNTQNTKDVIAAEDLEEINGTYRARISAALTTGISLGTLDGTSSTPDVIVLYQDFEFYPNPTGEGPLAVTFTITDSDETPIQSATVFAFLNGALVAQGTTDGNGQVTLGLSSGNYSIYVVAGGYLSTTVARAISISGDVSPIILTLSTPTPSSPGFVTGTYLCLNLEMNPEQGVNITMILLSVPETGDASVNLALRGAERTKVSDASGIATFTNIIPGATYLIRRGTVANRNETTVVIPIDSVGTVDLTSIIGSP